MDFSIFGTYGLFNVWDTRTSKLTQSLTLPFLGRPAATPGPAKICLKVTLCSYLILIIPVYQWCLADINKMQGSDKYSLKTYPGLNAFLVFLHSIHLNR